MSNAVDPQNQVRHPLAQPSPRLLSICMLTWHPALSISIHPLVYRPRCRPERCPGRLGAKPPQRRQSRSPPSLPPSHSCSIRSTRRLTSSLLRPSSPCIVVLCRSTTPTRLRTRRTSPTPPASPSCPRRSRSTPPRLWRRLCPRYVSLHPLLRLQRLTLLPSPLAFLVRSPYQPPVKPQPDGLDSLFSSSVSITFCT
jgi:hypothetical protein